MTIQDLNKCAAWPIITKDALRQLEKREAALNFNLAYWQKIGKLIPLKKGVYVLKDRFEKEADKTALTEFFANKMYEPSYLSGEYVMQKYGLLTEGVYGLTSCTTKKTASFRNSLGIFSYYSLSPSLFGGFSFRTWSNAKIAEAKKEKAVFDFLYLRFLKNAEVNEKTIDELRVNWENLKPREFVKMKKWVKLSKSKRIMELYYLIAKKYYDA